MTVKNFCSLFIQTITKNISSKYSIYVQLTPLNFFYGYQMLKIRTIFQTWLVIPLRIAEKHGSLRLPSESKANPFFKANNIDKNLLGSIVLEVFYPKSKRCHLFLPQEPYLAWEVFGV